MRSFKHILIGLALYPFIIRVTNAQIYHHHVSHFASLNPVKLTYKLTHNLKSDSAKVRAIHDWIASNIKYDVNKWLTSDYSQTNIKRILRHKKAICLGYSQLFQAMCTDAGIPCVIVTGYDKDNNVNVNDHLFLDEHAWNAVYVDSTWRLVDVCWDAGYLKITKRTFRGFFVHLFSGGKRDVVKYMPHFVKGCSEFYCLRGGSFFATDHLPLNPIWQLTYPLKTMAQFESDSSFYYKRYRDSNVNTSAPGFEKKRQEYLAMDEVDRSIADGLAGYAFNSRNHFEPCISNINMAALKIMDLNFEVYDTAAMIKTCDSTLFFLNRGIRHNDTTSRYMLLEKKEQMANNQRKRAIITRQNNKLIASTRVILHQLSSAQAIALYKGRQFTWSSANRNSALSIAEKGNAIPAKKNAKGNRNDSLECMLTINTQNKKITTQQEKIAKAYLTIDSMFAGTQQKLEKYADTSAGIINLENYVTAMRFNDFDDLDYEIRSPKDSLIHLQHLNDSLIFYNRKFILTPLFSCCDELMRQTENLKRLYIGLLQETKKLSAYCKNPCYAKDLYNRVCDSITTEFGYINEKDAKYSGFFTSMHYFLANMVTEAKTENTCYNSERRDEQRFFIIRQNYINCHIRGLLFLSKSLRKQVTGDDHALTRYTIRLKQVYRKKLLKQQTETAARN